MTMKSLKPALEIDFDPSPGSKQLVTKRYKMEREPSKNLVVIIDKICHSILFDCRPNERPCYTCSIGRHIFIL